MPLDTTLRGLDSAPTILEMRAFYKKHDRSAAKRSEPKSRSSEDHEPISYIQRIIDEAFEKETRAIGLAAWSGYFDKVSHRILQKNLLIRLARLRQERFFLVKLKYLYFCDIVIKRAANQNLTDCRIWFRRITMRVNFMKT